MNFLSHYYFERFAKDPEQVLGGLLPDLLKNVDKKYAINLSKFEDLVYSNSKYQAISEGWVGHLEVDKIFHSSDFFYSHTHSLRKHIETVVDDLPIRASFLAHIALELLLDHNLITHKILSVDRLYEYLGQVDRNSLRNYLKIFEIVDIAKFDNFYDKFVASRYIFKYEEIENIPHALFNICKRIWSFDIEEKHLSMLTLKLKEYNERELQDFKSIYTFIQDKLQ